MKITSTKIAPGLYQVGVNGRRFEIEDIAQASDGDCLGGWMLYEIVGEIETREFWNDFCTKRAAIKAIQSALAVA